MARKAKQNNNNNTIIEGGLQAALKLAGLVPSTSETTTVVDVEEKIDSQIWESTKAAAEAVGNTVKWTTYMGVPVPEEATQAIEEIHKNFLKEMEATATTAASAVAPAVAVEVQEAVLPKPVPASTTTSEWVIKAAAQLRFKSLKAHRPMSFRDIFKSRESRASEDALLLAQAEEEIRLELAAR